MNTVTSTEKVPGCPFRATDGAKGGLDYDSYLKLPALFGALSPKTELDGERFFITVHQANELWFREILARLVKAEQRLSEGALGGATELVANAGLIMEHLETSWRLFALLSCDEFAAFRGALGSASGMQSALFKQIESLLEETTAGSLPKVLLTRLEHPLEGAPTGSLPEVPLTRLEQGGAAAAHTRLRVSASCPEVCALIRALCDLDRRFVAWRRGHVAVVKRMLGLGGGTGGSSGVDYLAGRARTLMPQLQAMASGGLAAC